MASNWRVLRRWEFCAALIFSANTLMGRWRILIAHTPRQVQIGSSPMRTAYGFQLARATALGVLCRTDIQCQYTDGAVADPYSTHPPAGSDRKFSNEDCIWLPIGACYGAGSSVPH